MKKMSFRCGLVAVVVLGLTSSSFAQVFSVDFSSAAYSAALGSLQNSDEDLNLELLYGSSPDSLSSTSIVSVMLGSQNSQNLDGNADNQVNANGDVSFRYSIFDQSIPQQGSGPSYAGQAVYVEVLAWTGDYSSYQSALASGNPDVALGTSAVLINPANEHPFSPSDILGDSVVNLVPENPNQGVGNTVVPEPAAFPVASAGLVLASTLLFRRRQA